MLFSDVTERKRAEHALQESVALLRHHAQHDALTGLPNRVLFEDRLRLAVAAAERHGRPFTILFLDLDDFKAINDDLGHESGDVVLIEVARRLRCSLRASDTLARSMGTSSSPSSQNYRIRTRQASCPEAPGGPQ